MSNDKWKMIFDQAKRPKIMILSGWESVFFWIFSIAAILAGLLTVMARNAVHSAMFLISTLVSVAALFILLGAEFLAGVQVLVYVGGVMVLFLFVIMLVSVDRENTPATRLYTKQSAVAIVFTVLLSVAFMIAANRAKPHFAPPDTRQVATAQTAADVVPVVSNNTEQ